MTDTEGCHPDPEATAPARSASTALLVLTLAAAFAFGAMDQYLPVAIPASWPIAVGSFALYISKMSAPWLLVAFLAGAWQANPRRAALVGLAATWLAVLAYVIMIVSPMEGTHLGPPPPGFHHGSSWAQLTPHFFLMVATSQRMWFVGGLITGPLFGWLGYRWRALRSPVAGLVAVLPMLLEPGSRWLATRLGVNSIPGIPFSWSADRGGVAAELTELAIGLLLTVAVIKAMPRSRAATGT